MTDKHSNHTSEEATTDITSAFRADFSEPDTQATARAHDAISGIDELSNGSALLVIKRGPNAGSPVRAESAGHLRRPTPQQRHLLR